ncbi:hypothetical protein ACJX0J_015368, partial [Zea mays]
MRTLVPFTVIYFSLKLVIKICFIHIHLINVSRNFGQIQTILINITINNLYANLHFLLIKAMNFIAIWQSRDTRRNSVAIELATLFSFYQYSQHGVPTFLATHAKLYFVKLFDLYTNFIFTKMVFFLEKALYAIGLCME